MMEPQIVVPSVEGGMDRPPAIGTDEGETPLVKTSSITLTTVYSSFHTPAATARSACQAKEI